MVIQTIHGTVMFNGQRGNDQIRQRKRNAFPEQSGGQCTGTHPCGLSDRQIWECEETVLQLVTLLMGSTSLSNSARTMPTKATSSASMSKSSVCFSREVGRLKKGIQTEVSAMTTEPSHQAFLTAKL